MAWRQRRRILGMALWALAAMGAARAGLKAEAGPYRLEVATDPPAIAVGKAKLLIRVEDAAGKPVEAAEVSALVKMPTMDMGETEQRAAPVSGQPGVYSAPAAFMMAGDFAATVRVKGPAGAAKAEIPLATGQNTGTLSSETAAAPSGAPGAAGAGRALPWIAGLLLVGFIAYRMRASGQRLDWRGALHWQTLLGVALLLAMYFGARYAVERFRRPGSMTPIEAQAMEMNTPAPPGSAPVELATVTDGAVGSSVRYSGQALGYSDQPAIARVRGYIVWMPFYVGDRVKKGQVLARLDTSEVQPQALEREAMARQAQQGAGVARTEYAQSRAEAARARSEAAGKAGALADARAALEAANEDVSNAEAMLASARSGAADADAQADAARADAEYWKAQLERTRALLKAGAVSGEEYQRDQSAAAQAAAKLRQAQAASTKAQADIRAAESARRKAVAMVASARARITQAGAEQSAARSQIAAAEAASRAALQRIGQAESGVEQARAAAAQTAAQAGFTEIRSEIDGVVTQRLIAPGTLVSPGQAVLNVSQVRPIRVQANVPEADLRQVRVGAPVIIEAGGFAARAKVTSVSPAVDPASRTGVVEATLPNADGRFLPGAYVAMRVSLGRKTSAPRVPSRAVQWRTPAGGGVLSTRARSYVWTAEPAGAGQFTVHMKYVETGLDDGTYTEIRSGLRPGDRVVTAGYQFLRDGDTVTAGEGGAR